ncbi:GNAT family N-acetyltransferase [Rhodococcus sp. H36-A4]|uniref:GNAT family N-acetyltransferase n=1 Tax=Rhodococcus sp. H36-A4 TaxID=3004353 RepID=UPI0022AF0B49|nr:GNAT family N-acetyltransferase [Rhodococcus sp. H36-A4]MCZ4079119.1 GNAT family N-acetyltransferase [Rhodococcus sp. H36-A4]
MSSQEVEETQSVHPLDDPVVASLRGKHRRFARTLGRVSRFDPEVAPFLGHPLPMEEQDWKDIRTLFGPHAVVSLRGTGHTLPDGWELIDKFGIVQLDGSGLETRPLPGAVRLGVGDVADMEDLIARTQPGPFLPRTYELGTYLGIREDGALVAMAGERMHPPGWTEISAVCTDPAYRGRGLATQLVRAVGHGIRERGETPFLHASAANVGAIRLYLSIGFVLREESLLTLARTPA